MIIHENGVVTIEQLRIKTGFLMANEAEAKMAWANVQALKYQICKDGQSTEHEPVLILSERDYIPLDPLNTINQKERVKLASLNDIFDIKHAQAKLEAGTQDESKDTATIIIQLSFFLLAFYAVIAFIRGC